MESFNGEWLEAKICEESTEDGIACKGSNAPTFISVPEMVSLTDPTSSIDDPVNESNYKFDNSGNLVRVTAPSTNDCTADEGVPISAGSLFYCHKYKYHTTEELKAMSDSERAAVNSEISKLRITFRIKDPEQTNCTFENSLGEDIDGIKLPNSIYDPEESETTGQTCDSSSEVPSLTPPDGKTTCKKEFYCGNIYSNNHGKYFVNVRVKNTADGNISDIIGKVVNPVIKVMDGTPDTTEFVEGSTTETITTPGTVGQAERVYKLLISDARYKAIVQISIIIMFTFYGLGYLMGVSELSHSEIISRVIKIGIIYLFIGENGWDWFQKLIANFFKEGTDYLAFLMASSFDSSPEIEKALANNDFYDKSILFGSVDKVFGLFFSSAVQKKISALLFASIFGWAYLLIIYNSFLLYVYAVANAVLLYLTAQVFISILFTLGPIFFIFILFSQTKEMFDNWLKQLIGFSLQQIFLLTTLAFFNMLMYEVIKMSLGYKICWDEVWTINIIIRVTLMSFWTIASMPPRTNAQSEVGNFGNPEGIPSIFTILFIWVIASLMQKFISFMNDVAASISGGISASTLGSGVAQAAKDLKDTASHAAGKAWKASGGQAVKRLDKALFDSGEIAQRERKNRRAQNLADMKNRGALSSASKKAVSKYKKDNASKFAKMNNAEKKAALKEVKDNAMQDKAKELGISDKDLERLKSDKGVKYEGHNAFGYAVQAAKQSIKRGGNIRKNLDEKETNTSFSKKEAKAGLKNMKTDKERENFLKDIKKGKTHVKRGLSHYAGKAMMSADSVKRRTGAGNKTATAIAALANVTMVPAILNTSHAAYKSAKKGISALRRDGIGGTIRKGYNAARKDSRDYTEARKQLEKEGVVTKMKAGTGFARSKDEKKAIQERAKQNREQKNVSIQKQTDARTIGELEHESQVIFEEKQDAETNFVREKGSLASKVFGRRKSKTSPAATRASKKDKQKEAAKNIKSGKDRKAHLQDQAHIVADELSEVNEDLESQQDELTALRSDPEYKSLSEEANKNGGESTNEKYKEFNKKIQDGTVRQHRLEALQRNLRDRQNTIRDMGGGEEKAKPRRNDPTSAPSEPAPDASKSATAPEEESETPITPEVDAPSDESSTPPPESAPVDEEESSLAATSNQAE